MEIAVKEKIEEFEQFMESAKDDLQLLSSLYPEQMREDLDLLLRDLENRREQDLADALHEMEKEVIHLLPVTNHLALKVVNQVGSKSKLSLLFGGQEICLKF